MLKAFIAPDLSHVREARQLMNQVASLVSLDDQRLFDLQVVVSEACANAIEHGAREVEVAAWLLRDRIVVEVSSEGRFRSDLLSNEGSHRRGLGLSLMASLADQMQISRLTDNLTRLSLTFLLRPQTGADRGPFEPSSFRQSTRSKLLEDPRVHGLVLTPAEMRERRRREEQLTRQAYYDPLTGLANRALFFSRGEEALSRTGRDDGSVAVVLLDVDEFKSVNDSLGHAAGDQLLAIIGARLRSALRASDTAARLGGDEFAVLLEASVGPSDLASAAERILAYLREPYDLSTTQLSATFSMGITASSSTARTVAELLRQADVALYAAKSQGKDSWKVFEPSMLEMERAKRESEEELRGALESGEIVTYFQPILSTEHGRVVGLEALVRWDHHSGDLLLPGSFLDLAEATGLIVPLGYEVLGQACRCLCEWDARRPDSRLQLMVNVSPRQLRERGFIEQVGAALASVGLPPERLVLEITEEVLAGNSLGVGESLTALRETGARIAVDHFGTGYSCLSGLRDSPIDILKMAQPLVQAVDKTEQGVLLATAVMSLAGSLGVPVVAEGVEEHGQLERLQALGCDMWQGNRFSLAVSPREIPALLERRMRT